MERRTFLGLGIGTSASVLVAKFLPQKALADDPANPGLPVVKWSEDYQEIANREELTSGKGENPKGWSNTLRYPVWVRRSDAVLGSEHYVWGVMWCYRHFYQSPKHPNFGKTGCLVLSVMLEDEAKKLGLPDSQVEPLDIRARLHHYYDYKV